MINNEKYKIEYLEHLLGEVNKVILNMNINPNIGNCYIILLSNSTFTFTTNQINNDLIITKFY